MAVNPVTSHEGEPHRAGLRLVEQDTVDFTEVFHHFHSLALGDLALGRLGEASSNVELAKRWGKRTGQVEKTAILLRKRAARLEAAGIIWQARLTHDEILGMISDSDVIQEHLPLLLHSTAERKRLDTICDGLQGNFPARENLDSDIAGHHGLDHWKERAG